MNLLNKYGLHSNFMSSWRIVDEKTALLRHSCGSSKTIFSRKVTLEKKKSSVFWGCHKESLEIWELHQQFESVMRSHEAEMGRMQTSCVVDFSDGAGKGLEASGQAPPKQTRSCDNHHLHHYFTLSAAYTLIFFHHCVLHQNMRCINYFIQLIYTYRPIHEDGLSATI